LEIIQTVVVVVVHQEGQEGQVGLVAVVAVADQEVDDEICFTMALDRTM
jgi:hypothetical protein